MDDFNVTIKNQFCISDRLLNMFSADGIKCHTSCTLQHVQSINNATTNTSALYTLSHEYSCIESASTVHTAKNLLLQ